MMNGPATKNPVAAPLPTNPETLHGTLVSLYELLNSIDERTNAIAYKVFGQGGEKTVAANASEENLECVASWALANAREVDNKLQFISDRLR